MPSKCNPDVDITLIRALASGASIVKAAQMAGVSERTVHRKLNEPSFRQCLADVRWQIFDGSIGQLVAASREACDNLRDLLKSPSDHVRLNACRLILTHVVKLKFEMENERRLSDIEAELNSPGGSAKYFVESDPDEECEEPNAPRYESPASDWHESPDPVRRGSPDPAEPPDRQVSSSSTPTPKPAAPIDQSPQPNVNTPKNTDKSCQPTPAPVRQGTAEPVRRGSPDPAETADRQVSSSSTPANQTPQPAANTPENPDKSCQPAITPAEMYRRTHFTESGRRLTEQERLMELKRLVKERREQEKKANGG